MSPQSREAIEAAQSVLAAVAEGRKPEPAEIEKLRRLAPPLAKLPAAELATKVMQLVSEISGKDREAAVTVPKERRARVRGRRIGALVRPGTPALHGASPDCAPAQKLPEPS